MKQINYCSNEAKEKWGKTTQYKEYKEKIELNKNMKI